MLWRRDVLDAAGGIARWRWSWPRMRPPPSSCAAQGLRVRLVDAPFEQPLGLRGARDVWARQVRWARLRRASFPQYFLPELLAGGLPPILCCALAAHLMGLPVIASTTAFATLWYAAECALARSAGWQLSAVSPLAFLARDILLPALWIKSWLGNGFVWRGNAMRVDEDALLSPSR